MSSGERQPSEITPEMIEAGAEVLRSLRLGLAGEATEVAEDIFRAMRAEEVQDLEVPRYAEAAQFISDFEQGGGSYEKLIRRLYALWMPLPSPPA